ncbi:unnamed protein product [Caenorhabditis auriculariae]|uniref:Thioredoxin domain-containing protein n=1 Tax=Caenorhabditis auriculariae TaxID=2777116 RepID=A0A8S1HMP6_9PELO|nr:unnamed protein product [Caenorhabditis auriculariae]
MGNIPGFLLFLIFLAIFVSCKDESYILVEDYDDLKSLLRTKNNVLAYYFKKGSDVTPLMKKVAVNVFGIATIIFINCDSSQKLCKKMKADPQPFTLKHYANGEFSKDYDRKVSEASIVSFLKNPMAEGPWNEDPVLRDVVHVDGEDDFVKLMEKEKNRLWCFSTRPCVHIARTSNRILETWQPTPKPKKIGQDIGRLYQISAYPSLHFFDLGTDLYPYLGAKDKTALLSWIKEPSNPWAVKVKKDLDWNEDPGTVLEHVDERKLDAFLAKNPNSLIVFHAKWCSHCKKIRPIIEEFVEIAEKRKYQLKVAAIDGDKGDTISPKLFSTALEDAMRQLGWDEEHDWEDSTDIRGINIDGKVLTNLRFADDIVLFSSSTTELSSMLNDLDEVGKKIGLKMNVKKTQWMKNRFCDQGKVTLEGRDLQEVTSYIYLGREVNMVNDLQAEIGRRKRAGWAAFNSIKEVTSQLKDPKLRAHIFEASIIPAISYGTEVWPDTKKNATALRTSYRALERALIGTTRFEQWKKEQRSTDLRQLSQIRDLEEHIQRGKHRWGGHVIRRQDDRWPPLDDRRARPSRLENVWSTLRTSAKMDHQSIKNPHVLQLHVVPGYPTLRYYEYGMKKFDISERTLDGLLRWGKEPSNEPEAAKTWDLTGTKIVELTIKNAENVLKQYRNAFVLYYTPWCSHCKTMKNEFVEFAKLLKNEPNLVIAAADCNKYAGLCRQHEIGAYPSMKYFRSGKMNHQYKEGRGRHQLRDFLWLKIREEEEEYAEKSKKKAEKTKTPRQVEENTEREERKAAEKRFQDEMFKGKDEL